jgi:hypothetical protein
MKRNKAIAAKEKWVRCAQPGCGRRLTARQVEDEETLCETHEEALRRARPATAPPSRRVG